METLIIIVLFGGAAFYLGKKIYAQFSAKSGCSKGCAGACSVPSTLEKMSIKEESGS